jgi:glycosyltransferase involved in cell wall biosynthesis
MKPRILMALPQMPQDPSSGAARSATTAVEMAAEAGFEVHALATTATERGSKADPLEYLHSLGLEVDTTPPSNKNRREFRFTRRGISYTLLDTGTFAFTNWEPSHGRQFDLLFDRELESFQPDLLFTYGGLPGDVRRHRRARLKGCRIVFRVANLGYLQPGFFDHIDAVLTPSNFLTERYRAEIGMESTPLPPPLELDDVLAPELDDAGEPARDPIFVTMVNPSIEKGVFFFARLAEELGTRHPEIAILAIESRGVAGMVVEAGLRGGFDLRRHESIMIAGAVPRPRDIYTNTRVLLAPSVWEEPFGRVAAEALLNGVPPLVSDRGGLPESCNGGGFVLPLPADLTVKTRVPVSVEAVEPWIEVIVKLAFDEPFYRQSVARAREASLAYRRETLAPRYADFFRRALQSRPR